MSSIVPSPMQLANEHYFFLPLYRTDLFPEILIQMKECSCYLGYYSLKVI